MRSLPPNGGSIPGLLPASTVQCAAASMICFMKRWTTEQAVSSGCGSFEVGKNSADINRQLDRLEFLQGIVLAPMVLDDIPAHRVARLRRQGERYFTDDPGMRTEALIDFGVALQCSFCVLYIEFSGPPKLVKCEFICKHQRNPLFFGLMCPVILARGYRIGGL